MHRLLALTLAIGSLPAPLRAAAVVAPAVRISGPALGGVIPTLQLPSLTAPLSSPTPVFTLSPSLGLAPSLTGTPALHLPQAAIAGPSAEALKTPAPVLQAVSPARASALGAAAAGASMLPAARKGVSAEFGSHDASVLFDGTGRRATASHPVPAAGGEAPGWTADTFRGADGGTLHFRSRQGSYPAQTPTVYAGGLALAESYESIFTAEARPAADQYFLWLRGHAPSPWAPTTRVYDADALDLARMIVTAGRRSGSGRIDLALHSYSVLVFQRMLQLRRDPEVRQALALLRGARVTLINATTHYGDSETAAGAQYAEMAKAIRMLVQWLDMMDSYAAAWEAAARLNPVAAPSIRAGLAAWRLQREAVLALASKGAVDELRKHLAEPWAPAIDFIRRDLLEKVARNAQDRGWQEALLRRANDTSKLEFRKSDVALLRRLGVRIDVVHSHDDQLIPWVSAKLLLDLMGIAAPEAAPPADTVLRSPDGLFRLFVVDGDHYFPLKQPAAMGELLRR